MLVVDVSAHCILVGLLSSVIKLLILVHLPKLELGQLLIEKNVLVVALVDVDAVTQAVLVIELVYLLDHMLGILFVWLMLRLAQQVHVVLLLACQLPLLIGTQALSFGVLHV